jgi:hypothetical protein
MIFFVGNKNDRFIFFNILAIPSEIEFLLTDMKNLFIGFAKPKGPTEQNEQTEQKYFFDVLIQNIFENSKKQSFGKIFESVCSKLPAGSVGCTHTSDFNFDLRLCEEGWFLHNC